MNTIIKYFAIAGILFLGACGSSNDEPFSSRFISISPDLAAKIIATQGFGVLGSEQREIVSRDYLNSISFDIPNDADIFTVRLTGTIVVPNTLTYKDGIFMINSLSDTKIENHTFVGILPATNVGAPLTASANFKGIYIRSSFVAPGRTGRPYDYTGTSNSSITLTADFNEGTLTGSARESVSDGTGRNARLMVNGRFSSNTLSGSVTYNSPSISDRTFTAPLSGMIGEKGAVGVFSSHENTGDGAGYAFGGGFVVGKFSQ